MDTKTNLLKSFEEFRKSLSLREQEALIQIFPLQRLQFESEDYDYLFLDAENFLTVDEYNIFAKLNRSERHSNDCLMTHIFMIMKATRYCNLRCTYCNSGKDGPNQTMNFYVLAKATRDVLRNDNIKHVDFVWHGGEVTLLSINFFKKALWLQRAFKLNGQVITNSLQTNGTNLTDEWISFIKSNNIQIGVSIDGPPEIHDKRRLNINGKATSETVHKGINKLLKADIPFGVLVVIDKDTIRYGPRKLLEYLVQLNVKGCALLNVIPDNMKNKYDSKNYLPWPDFVNFLEDLFEVWWNDYRDKISIRELQSLVQSMKGYRPTICEFAGNCMGQFLTIEPNGEVSACDKYIGDKNYIFGNLLETDLVDIMTNSRNLQKSRIEVNHRMEEMSKCKYIKYCSGGCPHDLRMNDKYLKEFNRSCCGLYSMFEKIEDAIKL